MKKIILLFSLLIFMLCSCTQTNQDPTDAERLNDLVSSIKENLNDVSQVTTTVNIKDFNVLVYAKAETISVTVNSDNTLNLAINYEESKLDSSGELVNQNGTDNKNNVTTDNLFNYNLDYNNFSSIELNNNSVIGTILASKAKETLGNGINNDGNVSLELYLNNEAISSLTISYKTTNNNDVTIVLSYTY